MWSKKEMLISWENAGLPGSLASILQKGKTDEKCHQSYSFFTSKRAKEATVPSGPFFYNQIPGSDNILEGRANSKKISIWKEEDSILAFQIPIIFCRMLNVHTTWSQLMLKLDNWRLICIPTLFLQLAGLLLATTKLQFILNLTFEKSTVENFVRQFSPHSLKLNPKKKVLHTSTTIFASGKLQKEQKNVYPFFKW